MGQWGLGLGFGGWGRKKKRKTQGFDGLGYLKVGDFGGFWSWGFGVVLGGAWGWANGAGPRSEVRGLGFAKRNGNSGWGLGLGQGVRTLGAFVVGGPGLGLGLGPGEGGSGLVSRRGTETEGFDGTLAPSSLCGPPA